jgi:hypothetical protein
MSSRVSLSAADRMMEETAVAAALSVLEESPPARNLNPDAALFQPHEVPNPQPPSYEKACKQLQLERQKETAKSNSRPTPPQRQRKQPQPVVARSKAPVPRVPAEPVVRWCPQSRMMVVVYYY